MSKLKIKVFGFLLFFLFLSGATLLFLDYHLFTIQREERLQKVSDYNMFILTYTKQKHCEKKKKFELEEISYYYDCLDNIYLNYGTNKVTLEEAMLKHYVTLDMLFKKMQKISEEDKKRVYAYSKNNQTDGYQMVVNLVDNDISDITFSSYQREMDPS